jgi:hypothetical protein
MANRIPSTAPSSVTAVSYHTVATKLRMSQRTALRLTEPTVAVALSRSEIERSDRFLNEDADGAAQVAPAQRGNGSAE